MPIFPAMSQQIACQYSQQCHSKLHVNIPSNVTANCMPIFPAMSQQIACQYFQQRHSKLHANISCNVTANCMPIFPATAQQIACQYFLQCHSKLHANIPSNVTANCNGCTQMAEIASQFALESCDYVSELAFHRRRKVALFYCHFCNFAKQLEMTGMTRISYKLFIKTVKINLFHKI